MSRLPVFHDDQSFRQQTERMFREMEENMALHGAYNPAPVSAPLPGFISGGARWPPMGFDDSNFFQLRPSSALTQPVLYSIALEVKVGVYT